MIDPHAQYSPSPSAALTVRIALTSVFWGHAVVMLAGPYGSLGELPSQGTDALRFYLLMTICLQLLGSLLVITDRGMWVGASALAAQTVVTLSVERSGSGLYAPGILPHIQLVLTQVAALPCIVGLALFQSMQSAGHLASMTDKPSDGNGSKAGNWRYI